MSEFNRDQTVYVNEQAGLKDYIVGVFTKMGIALLITAASAYGLYASNLIGRMAMSSPGILSMLYMLAIAVEFGIVIYLSSRLTTMSTNTATGLFYGYAVVTGLTFSTLFYAYDASTIAISFLFTAVVFFSCAIIGRFTNVDLSRFSGIMMGGLVALILVSILGMFIPAIGNSLLLSYVGILLFCGITAWDMQRIMSLYYQTNGGYGQTGANLAIYGAFELYLDFINLFLRILSVFGNRRRN
ncbi:MAG: Bax inhibitor-1/YccA family protein [Galactobacillus timonensis]|jgi:FtsH-binding integral membrane protein|uniref:Bax inhibitor-1/YccA family protein n=1 Tax=Galactobacillus timonensis TaxID=2041840 RepID=UPI000C85C1A3|nr:Bax inhibitor-1/YccA family protein [Galactobacillus timonensis]MDY6283139.1 Bax inhibitor-1/YccA family protein [Erysipelotrichaceae bacterium]MDD5851407.1 Bax inhibitor-1/YccA family protein [Galactobacillus timonensis]MDD6370700.1 Bax inhibitor-1/YccA family protein [Galactobacillus timonensis]MDD6600654.1 Bax inhibitor-1/YccA family protein [Galactobacillus timonensis]MDD6681121.1 Bax inhibitor-1/YccA family protein [Galactobacillus timonensis]